MKFEISLRKELKIYFVKRRRKRKKEKPEILKTARKVGEFLGMVAVTGEEKARKTAKEVEKLIEATAETIPQLIEEFRKGVKAGTRKARKKKR